jgi:hypothetical protein
MAIKHLHMLSACTIGRKARPDVNTRKSARKLLESLDGSIGGDAAIMDGKGAPEDGQRDFRRLWFGWFILLVSFNRINKTNQMNKIGWRTFSAPC